MKEILFVGISWQNTGKEKSLGADQVDLNIYYESHIYEPIWSHEVH